MNSVIKLYKWSDLLVTDGISKKVSTHVMFA